MTVYRKGQEEVLASGFYVATNNVGATASGKAPLTAAFNPPMDFRGAGF